MEYRIAPETTAALAYAPSLGLVPTSPARGLEDRLWDTFFLVLAREETREMLADDFRRRVALICSAPAFQLATNPSVSTM
jgi:hypothetical protein